LRRQSNKHTHRVRNVVLRELLKHGDCAKLEVNIRNELNLNKLFHQKNKLNTTIVM
jgi:hypothetical protein